MCKHSMGGPVHPQKSDCQIELAYIWDEAGLSDGVWVSFGLRFFNFLGVAFALLISPILHQPPRLRACKHMRRLYL